jgi:hypothetical protein
MTLFGRMDRRGFDLRVVLIGLGVRILEALRAPREVADG